jgi:hypothetical protein
MKVFSYGCKPWRKRDDEWLKAMHEMRQPIKEIAIRLHRTEEAIRHRKKKLGLRRILSEDSYHIIMRKRKHLRKYIQCTN